MGSKLFSKNNISRFCFLIRIFSVNFFHISTDSFEFTCELDEYAFLKKELQESGIVKDLRSGLKSYKNSFHGKEAVDFLVKTKNLGMVDFLKILCSLWFKFSSCNF